MDSEDTITKIAKAIRASEPINGKNGAWTIIRQNWGKLIVVAFAAGGIAWQVGANTTELAKRRGVIEKIPVLEERLDTVIDNQKEILREIRQTNGR